MSINLLTRDGGLRVTFFPALAPDQYGLLAEKINAEWSTRAELDELLRKLARTWDRKVEIDPC